MIQQEVSREATKPRREEKDDGNRRQFLVLRRKAFEDAPRRPALGHTTFLESQPDYGLPGGSRHFQV